MRICHITSVDTTLAILFAGQLSYKIDLGFEVWGVCSPGASVEAVRAHGVHVHPIRMARASASPGDLISLARMIGFFLTHRFDIVEMSTPKAVLLGSIAAWITRQPTRIVTLRGAYYESMTGLKRRLCRLTDKLGCLLAHRVVTICHELGQMIVRDRLCAADKVTTYLSGSSNGLDLSRFTPTPERIAAGRRLRSERRIADEAIVIGNVGRLRCAKGTGELVDAFETLLARGRNVYLLLVGGYETVDPLPPELRLKIETHPRIINVGHQPDTENYYTAMDIFAFPTYREGFGNVGLEASAMGLPIVASDVMGVRESAPGGIAALAVPPRDAAALADALDRLIADPDLRRQLAEGGQKRAREQFARQAIWHAMLADYAKLLARRGKSLPPRAAAIVGQSPVEPPEQSSSPVRDPASQIAHTCESSRCPS